MARASVVRGTCVKASSPKTTRPMRSSGRPATKRAMTSFAADKRLTRRRPTV